MKIKRISQFKPTVIRHKDPIEQRKMEHRQKHEKINRALDYLKTIAQIIRDLETDISHDAMPYITDLYAIFKQTQNKLAIVSSSLPKNVKTSKRSDK